MERVWTSPEKGPLEEVLEACAKSCRKSAEACLRESDANELAECVRLEFECAKICEIAALYLDKGSVLQDELLYLCAEACDKCGSECEKHFIRHSLECANACRRCGRACMAYAEAAA
jgi:hypothetical protein